MGTRRRENQLPLKKIAVELGVSISTVNAWERGERFPTGHNFQMLVEYTGLPPCRLFFVMADRCGRVPAGCMLAMHRISPPED